MRTERSTVSSTHILAPTTHAVFTRAYEYPQFDTVEEALQHLELPEVLGMLNQRVESREYLANMKALRDDLHAHPVEFFGGGMKEITEEEAQVLCTIMARLTEAEEGVS